jgi:hypothetical protein
MPADFISRLATSPAPRNETACNKKAAKSRLLPLMSTPTVPHTLEVDARARALVVGVVMVPAVPRDATDVQLTIIASTSPHPEEPPPFNLHGDVLQQMSLDPRRKRSHQ